MIYTFNARNNILLDILKDNYNLTDLTLYNSIQSDLNETKSLLQSIGKIRYDDLKQALIPTREKKEILIVFDSTKTQEAWYGKLFGNAALSIMQHHKTSTYSVLSGDYHAYCSKDSKEEQKFFFEILSEHLVVLNSTDYKHNTQFYFIYINNLTKSQFDDFNKLNCEGFVGYIDLTFDSKIKNYVSNLGSRFIKHRNTIIMSSDIDPTEQPTSELKGYNSIGLDFEKHGFKIMSMPPHLYDYYLSYKIESHQIQHMRDDESLTNIALFGSNLKLSEIEVILCDAKNNYLHRKKSGSLKQANLFEKPPAFIAEKIQSSLKNNYIYNLKYEHDVYNFAIKIEDQKFRYLCALAYHAEENNLTITTLY